jgi:predicted nucleic acid-binding protein
VPVFVDTNVLVYARDASEPEKQRGASRWLTRLWESREARTSVQVLEEYYVTVTQRLDPGMVAESARKDIGDLCAWRPQPIEVPLLEEAWRIQDRYGLSFWDCLIVASARAQACDRLLTEDLQDGQDFGGVVAVDPFLHEPA